jgi:hypothetical protein
MPTFRIKTDSADKLMTLTTPISYITSFFTDPFADTKGAAFAYSPTPLGYGTGWILWSYGPDVDENAYQNATYPIGGDIKVDAPIAGWTVQVAETYYNAGGTVPSGDLLLLTYDPTNGTTSNGDVWRVKQ